MCCHIEDVATKAEDRGKRLRKDDSGGTLYQSSKDNDCYKVKLNCEESVIPFYDSLRI